MAAWETYLLFKTTVARFRRAELDEEQQAKAKAACGLAAKELAEAGEDKKATRAIGEKLRWGIEAFVLTAEQRETLATQPTRKGGKRNKDEGQE